MPPACFRTSACRLFSQVMTLWIVLGNMCVLYAGNITWTNGSGNDLWQNSANWSAAYPNTTSDTAIFNNLPLVPNPISLGGSVLVNRVWVNVTQTGTMTLGSGTSDTLTVKPANRYDVGFQIQGTSTAHADVILNANLVVSNQFTSSVTGPTYITLNNNSSLTLAAGNTVSLGAVGAMIDLGGDNLTGSGHGTGTLNFNANFDTANATTTALQVDAGVVNWNVGTFTNSNASSSLIAVRGVGVAATLNFQKSLVSTSGITGGIMMGAGSAVDQINNLFGTADGVVVGANIGTTVSTGAGGKALNIFTIGANDTSATAAARSTMTFSGNYSISDTTYSRTHRFQAAANNTAVFSGGISSTANASTAGSVLQKTGAGTVIFSGSTANTSILPLEVVEGKLILSKTAGTAAITGNVQVDAGAILELAASEQIANSSNLTLAGGSFAVGAATETLGTLSLTDNSILTLDGGSAYFANSSLIDWSSFTLTIHGSVSSTALRFGTTGLGLTQAQLARLVFADYGGAIGQIDSQGFVTAVPEPATMALLMLGLAAVVGRRRLR